MNELNLRSIDELKNYVFLDFAEMKLDEFRSVYLSFLIYNIYFELFDQQDQQVPDRKELADKIATARYILDDMRFNFVIRFDYDTLNDIPQRYRDMNNNTGLFTDSGYMEALNIIGIAKINV